MFQSRISICGSDVQYWTSGPADARTILMVHGFRGNHVGLLKIVAGLGDYRVIVPDLPGYGLSTPMTEHPHDVSGYSEFVKALIAELRLDRPVLLGHSYGSIIASHVAATEPDLISELILVSPIAASPGMGINRPFAKMVEGYYWLSGNLPDPLAEKVLMSRIFNRLMSLTLTKTRDRDTRRAIYRHHLGDLGFPQDRRVIAESFPDSIAKTAADEAEHIPHRTLLVAGEKDGLSPAKYQRRLSGRLARSTLVLIPRVGHLVHLETPTEAAKAIDDFMAEEPRPEPISG
jgi:pimeloyl-ACP methyl ester carboxylesterase